MSSSSSPSPSYLRPILPLELYRWIIESIDPLNDKSTLITLSCVSRIFNHEAERILYSDVDPFHVIHCRPSLSSPLLGIRSIQSTCTLFFDAIRQHDGRRARHVRKLRVGSMGKLLALDFKAFTDVVELMGEALPGALRECVNLRELEFYRSHVKRFGKVAGLNNKPRCASPSLPSTSTDVFFLDGCSFQLEYLNCLQDDRQPILPMISFLRSQQRLVHLHLGGTFESTAAECFKQFHTLSLPALRSLAVSTRLVVALLPTAPNLHSLYWEADDGVRFSDDEWDGILPHLRKLHVLTYHHHHYHHHPPSSFRNPFSRVFTSLHELEVFNLSITKPAPLSTIREIFTSIAEIPSPYLRLVQVYSLAWVQLEFLPPHSKEPTTQTRELTFPSEWFAQLPALCAVNIKSDILNFACEANVRGGYWHWERKLKLKARGAQAGTEKEADLNWGIEEPVVVKGSMPEFFKARRFFSSVPDSLG
jgi:hypothetical protein